MFNCQQTHKSHRNYHLITVRLRFINKTIGCVHQTRPRKGTRHSAACFAHTYRLGTMSRMEVLLHQALLGFYHLNKTLIATKHIADNTFVFQLLQ